MTLFYYSARNSDGHMVQGTIEAVSLQAAREALSQQNLKPEQLLESKPESKSDDSPNVSHAIDLQESESEQEINLQWKVPTEVPEDEEDEPKKPIANLQEDLKKATEKKSMYVPIVETLRLYAGWLLTGYFIAFSLGYYQLLKDLPFDIPYVLAFFYSPLILSFTLAAFLFLLATELQKFVKQSVIGKSALFLLMIGVFVVYRMNI